MNELWEDFAALGETRHQVVMFLLNRAFTEPDGSRVRRIFAAVDEINRRVDDVDRLNASAISQVQMMLSSGLARLQHGALTGHAVPHR